MLQPTKQLLDNLWVLIRNVMPFSHVSHHVEQERAASNVWRIKADCTRERSAVCRAIRRELGLISCVATLPIGFC